MIRPIWIEDEKEIIDYQLKINELLGIDFPLEYLKQGRLRAFANNEGKIVGGYSLIMRGPFRTLSSIPDDVDLSYISQDKLMEVTALFLDRKNTSGPDSCIFWYTFSRDLSTQEGKTNYVYAYDLSKLKLKTLYSLAKPQVVYQGTTKKLEGMKSEGQESIEIAKCKTIAYLPFYGIRTLGHKLLFKQIKKTFTIRKLARI